MLHFDIEAWAPYWKPAMAYDGCDLSYMSLIPYVSLLASLASFATRYRAIIFRSYYRAHNKTPIRLCKVTAVPWEAIFVLGYLIVPRFVWASQLAKEAVAQGAWDKRDLSGSLGWIMLVYLVAIDLFERRMAKKVIAMYFAVKDRTAGSFEGMTISQAEKQLAQNKEQHALNKEQYEDQRTRDVDVESQGQQRTRFCRLRAWLDKPRNNFELSAANMLTQLHLSAFIKALLIFVLLSQTAITTCWFENRMDTLFDLSSNLFLPLIFVSALYTVRLFGVICRSIRFGRTEVDIAAVNGQ